MQINKGIYQHYKGQYYEVLMIAQHSETLEQLVVYQALYGDKELWVRPLVMFAEQIIVDDNKILRFKFITSADKKH
ncbi:MAG: DUF1653 domain-containing protein [Rickettsiaceae bacterium]|nr:MAG: DUF1653 domain-containing protein [Rickettsiaceae bacterium]